jgi:hypothetical protein
MSNEKAEQLPPLHIPLLYRGDLGHQHFNWVHRFLWIYLKVKRKTLLARLALTAKENP